MSETRLKVMMSPIDSAGQYPASLALGLRRKGLTVEPLSTQALATQAPDIVHLHWEHLLFGRTFLSARAARWLATLQVARLRGTRVVYTLHNVHPHDLSESRFAAAARRSFDRIVDGLIVHSQSGANAAARERPLLPARAAVIEHGALTAHGDLPTMESARERLSIPRSSVVLAALGRIAPYKGLEQLVSTFVQCGFGDKCHLIVAGAPAGSETGVSTAAAGATNVHVDGRTLPDSDLLCYVAAADCLVGSYKQITTSGAAYLGLSYQRRFAGPSMGGLPELQANYGDAQVHLFEPPVSETAIRAVLDWCSAPAPSYWRFPPSWDDVAERTKSFYSEVIAGGSTGA